MGYGQECCEARGTDRESGERFLLEAVVVCDRYSDFLRCTLPHNKHHFDRMVVVTSYEDTATRKLCEYWHVECLPTDLLGTRKGEFCKGCGINVGLRALGLQGWALHLDADILLPPQTRLLLARAGLDPRMLYGCDRYNVKGYAALDAFLEAPRLQHEAEAYIHADAFPLGTRVMCAEAGGYVPIGFFQLWHPGASGVRRYLEGHTDAGREDFKFALQWQRRHRHLLPEIIGYHLESTDSAMSVNWQGRKSAPFTHGGAQNGGNRAG